MFEIVVTQRQTEALTERFQVVDLQFFLPVRRHLALPCRAHTVALHGLRKDHRRLTAMGHRARIGRAQLHGIVATAFQAINVAVGHVGNECSKLRILAEKAFAVVRTVIGRKSLELPINRFAEGALQHAGNIARKQHIPVRSPQRLDHIPAGTDELRFKLIDDAAIAAHRAVETLQIAVDDENEVIEFFARGQR